MSFQGKADQDSVDQKRLQMNRLQSRCRMLALFGSPRFVECPLRARSSHSSLAKFYYWGRGEFAKTRADYEPSHET